MYILYFQYFFHPMSLKSSTVAKSCHPIAHLISTRNKKKKSHMSHKNFKNKRIYQTKAHHNIVQVNLSIVYGQEKNVI